MKLGIVKGTITSTHKHEVYNGRKLMVIQPITPEGKPVGKEEIAVDTVGAGVGEVVLFLKEGGSARSAMHVKGTAPVNEVIIGIVDTIQVHDQTTFHK